MAKKLTYQLLPNINVPEAYAMIGETHIYHFDQRAEIVIYVFQSEDARHQRLAPHEVEAHRPMKKIIVCPTLDEYATRLEEVAKELAAAGYRLITEVSAGMSAEPRGLKELLEGAEDY